MKTASDSRWLSETLDATRGILPLTPAWVPRSFMIPGRRLRLDPKDLYCLGMKRGGINERWFSSTTPADNGPGTPPDEGLSYIVFNDRRMTLQDAIKAEGERILGRKMYGKFKAWTVYAKFFDNEGPIPHHVHQMQKHAEKVGRQGKPEAYYFPPEFNPHNANFPYTFFGLTPGTTKKQVKACLDRWEKGDNGLLHLSQAYQLERDTGWALPPGLLHAPGSFCTFEVQWASDVFAFFQNLVEGRYCDRSLLVKDVPKNKHHDLDYLVSMLDWEANVDPLFYRHHHLKPIAASGDAAGEYVEFWVIYGRYGGKDIFSAKRLIVQPGAACTIKDTGPHGVFVTNGRGRIGPLGVSATSMVRYGEPTEDEVFVTGPAAAEGVTVENTGSLPLTLLKFFGPDSSPNMPRQDAWQ
jgi:hypothetical protein